MLQESIAIRAVSERDIQYLGVFQCLAHASANRVVVVLRLHNRKGEVGFVREDEVGLFGFAAFDPFAANDHPAFRKIGLLTNLRHHIPLARNNRRQDEFRANVGFSERFFVHGAVSKSESGPTEAYCCNLRDEEAHWLHSSFSHTRGQLFSKIRIGSQQIA